LAKKASHSSLVSVKKVNFYESKGDVNMKAKQVFQALGGILGAIVLGVLLMASNGDDCNDKLTPADNYGPEGTWYHMVFWKKINFEGSSGTNRILVLGGMSQNICNNIKNYRDVSDSRSVKLYDSMNPDSYLPEGMKVYLYWGRKCSDWRPYGVITVPANAKEIRVPRLNKPSANYEVFNNFQQRDGGDRKLNGHVNGIFWYIPE
jgi:hypothetical protein